MIAYWAFWMTVFCTPLSGAGCSVGGHYSEGKEWFKSELACEHFADQQIADVKGRHPHSKIKWSCKHQDNDEGVYRDEN